MLPATIVFVFIGTTLASITDAVKGDYEGNTATLVLLIGGSVLALGGVFWISYVVKKYLNQQMELVPSEELKTQEQAENGEAAEEGVEEETGYFAGGCFWGVEYAFGKLPGVISVESGYQQGHLENPTYRQVCSGTSGHAESVKVVYDSKRISFAKLCKFFIHLIDPTTLNRQGPDQGTQYRSGIYVENVTHLEIANKVIQQEQEACPRFFTTKIVTEVQYAKTFYPAEDKHQDYINKTGRTCHVQLTRAIKAIR